MATRLPPPLLAVLDAQAGAVLLRQVHDAGLTREHVRARVAAGHWRRWYPRVYITYDGPVHRATEQWAALLYAGAGAVLSHRTAAEVWELLDTPAAAGSPVEVAVPMDRRVRDQPGLRVYSSRRLPTSTHPTRVPPRTRVEDTVLDLAAQAGEFADVVSLVSRACQRRRTSPARLRAALADRPTLPWRGRLQELLADVDRGAQSPLELAYLRSVERPHGLPRSDRQARRRAGGGSQWVDVRYDEYLLVVELDGRLGHVGDGAFRDRRRDNLAAEGGYWTLRYGWAETVAQSCEVAAQVARVLRLRGWRGRLRHCRRCGNPESKSWEDLWVS